MPIRLTPLLAPSLAALVACRGRRHPPDAATADAATARATPETTLATPDASAPSVPAPTPTPHPAPHPVTAAPGSSDDTVPVEQVPANARVTFNFRDATLDTAVRALGSVTGHAVVLGPDVAPLVDCVTLTIYAPQPVTPAQAERLFISALHGSALRATAGNHSVRIERDRAVPLPSTCNAAGQRQ